MYTYIYAYIHTYIYIHKRVTICKHLPPMYAGETAGRAAGGTAGAAARVGFYKMLFHLKASVHELIILILRSRPASPTLLQY